MKASAGSSVSCQNHLCVRSGARELEKKKKNAFAESDRPTWRASGKPPRFRLMACREFCASPVSPLPGHWTGARWRNFSARPASISCGLALQPAAADVANVGGGSAACRHTETETFARRRGRCAHLRRAREAWFSRENRRGIRLPGMQRGFCRRACLRSPGPRAQAFAEASTGPCACGMSRHPARSSADRRDRPGTLTRHPSWARETREQTAPDPAVGLTTTRLPQKPEEPLRRAALTPQVFRINRPNRADPRTSRSATGLGDGIDPEGFNAPSR